MSRDPLVPGAIVIGGALIGLGLYAGLRETGSRYVPIPSSSPTNETSSGAAPSSEQPSESSFPREIETARATAAAEAAFGRLKSGEFVPKCWRPAIQASSEPATSFYRFQSTFDRSGNEIARGVSELRDRPSRPDVARCLRTLALDAKLDFKPAANVSVIVYVTFP